MYFKSKLAIGCALLIIGGCECKKCDEKRAELIGEYDFQQIDDYAGSSNQCDQQHAIGIAEGGSKCLVAVVGLDGWGITDSLSVVQGEVVEEAAFELLDGQVIRGAQGAGCSGWRNIEVAGGGERIGNLLRLRLSFSDSASGYSSGEMQYTYQLR